MANSRSVRGRLRGRPRASFNQPARLHRRTHTLAPRVEKLEDRNLLATYAYPYGAQAFDTGEYMLGDVAVNVVLMESNRDLAPYDNNPANAASNPGIGAPAENWTADAIAAVKSNITAGLQWWKDTLYNMFPSAPANLLNFHINWQYADNPVQTGYEPIARVSDDFFVFNSSGGDRGWIYDFLEEAGFDYTGNFSSDIRSYNDYTRQVAGTDWAFTIFVVNNAVDSDKFFASGGSFQQAFAFSGGRFMVVPASRPASTYAHETGHQFWAIDQYLGGGSYASQRGYYNTPNLNAADNPTPGFVQADSIMARDETNKPRLTNAYNNHTSDQYALAQIGWQDSDSDGIFDVLDVPFSLSGSGAFNVNTGIYKFDGSTVVGTLPNQNSSGSGNDITINQINVIQASIDGGGWQTVKSFDPRTYQANFSVNIPIPAVGIHEIRLRSADLRTGVTSNIFIDDVETPTDPPHAVTGIVFRDLNSNGRRDAAEPPLPDVGITILDEYDQPLDFVNEIEPSLYPQGMVLNGVAASEGVTIFATGPNVASGDVFARTSTIAPTAGRVFESNLLGGIQGKVWNSGQKLQVNFNAPVGTVSLKAFGGSGAGVSYGRLEAYDINGTLLTRYNTGALSTGASATMTVSRSSADISYVVAYGRLGTSVVLDTLEWGASTSATSSNDGTYSLGNLPTGTYHIRVIPPAGYTVTTPPYGYTSVSVVHGQQVGAVDFGIAAERAHPYHNLENPYNVNNDVANTVAPVDALMVINYLNSRPPGAEGEIGENDFPTIIGFVDVTDDGYCAPNDALAVINYINANRQNGQGGESGEGLAPDETGPEGELRFAVPGSAAEYFAHHGALWLNAPRGDDEPCTCASCVGASTDAVFTALGAASDLEFQAGPAAEITSAIRRTNASQRAADRPLDVSTGAAIQRGRLDFLAKKPAAAGDPTDTDLSKSRREGEAPAEPEVLGDV